MSDKIKELALKAFLPINAQTTEGIADMHTFDQPWFQEYSQRFAELIVSECISETAMIGVTNSENEDIAWAVDVAVKNIKSRLGDNNKQHTKLEQQDHERFFDAIDKSPEPTQALRDLFKADIAEHDAMMLEHYMNQYVYFKDLCFDVLEEKINREDLAVALHGFERGHDA